MARGGIINRGPNTWRIAYDLPREPGEPRKQKFVTVKGSHNDAEKKLREILSQIDKNTYVDSGKNTLADFLQRWLNDYCQPSRLKQTTIDSYQMIIEKHLIPALGDIQLAKLQPIQIQKYYSQKLKSGLSGTTVLHHHRLLHRAFSTAMKWQLMYRNTCDAVEPPKAEQFEGKTLNEEQAEILLHIIKDTTLYIPVLIAIGTGLRRGEIVGLRWSDFHPEIRLLTVNQTIVKTSHGIKIETPKTKQSRRAVTISSFIVDELKIHKEKQDELKNNLDDLYVDNDLICCKDDGTPWAPNSISDYFYRVIKRHSESHGLPIMRFHDLRHTHASLLLKNKINIKETSERMGHSRTGITLDLYSHVMPGFQDAIADMLDEVLFNRLRSKQDE